MMSLRPETAVSGPNLTLKTDITCEDPTSLLCRAQQLQEVGWSSETSERKANIISSPTTSLVESPTITMCGESAVREHQTSSNLGSPLVFVWNSGAASPTSSINQLEYSRSDQIVEGAAEQLKKLGGDDTWDRGPCSSKEKEVQEKPLSPQTTAPVKQSMWDGLQDDIIAAWSRPIEEQCDVRWGAHVERDPSENEDLKHASYFQISAKEGNQDDSVFIADTVSEQKSRSPVPGGGVSDPRASPDFPPHFDGVSAFPEPQTIANPELKAFVASPTESVSSGCVSDLTLNVDCDNSGDDLLNVSGRYDKIDFGFESTGSPLVSPCNGRGRSPSELPRIVVNGKNANSKHEAPMDPCEDLDSQSVSAPHSDIASWGDDRRSPVECVQNAGNHRRSRQITLELFEAANDIVSVSERRASFGNDASSFSRFPARDMTSRSFKDSHEDIRLESCPFSARNNNLRDESPRRPESRMGNRSPERMIRPPSRIGEEHEVEQDSVRFISSAEDLSYRSRLISSPARVERIHTRGMIELTAGLKNLTNTCYMNSAIQALAHCIPFARFFVRNEYIHSLRDTKRSTLCVLFAQLLTALWRKWDTTKVLKLFCRQIKMRCPMYRNFEQQDSHEFLLNFLTLLHEDLNVAPKSGQKAPCDVPDSIVTSETFSERFNNFIAAHEDRERSIVTSNFEGVLASRLKCLTCEKDSFTFEEFTVLSIPVPCHRRKLDLQACLDEFFKVETVDEWRCPHCEEKRTALKELRIAKLPQNLIIHFIRGNAPMIPFMMLMREVNNRVHFTEDLDARDIAQYLCNKDVQKKNYTLYAIVKHFGNLNSGHYIAECRSLAGKNQPWVRYSDDAVSLATYPIDVDNAFMLFFSSIPQQLSTFASSLSE